MSTCGWQRCAMALTFFTGITAVTGGAALIYWHAGVPWLPPLQVLQHSPFADFLGPGAILLVLVGLPNLAAGAVTGRRDVRAGLWVLAAGALLTGWIVIQMVLLRMIEWLQLLYLAVGIATLMCGFRVQRLGYVTSAQPK